MSLRQNIKSVGKLPSLTLAVILLVAALSLHYAVVSLKSDSALSLWALGLAFFLASAKRIPSLVMRDRKIKFIAAGVAFAGVAATYFNLPFFCLFMSAISVAIFFGGIRVALRVAAPFAIWILCIANYDAVMLAASYPMRVLEVKIANALLAALDYKASVLGTSIFIGGKEIIITTACSGIEHLWTIILFAWCCAWLSLRSPAARLVSFLCIIPIFIFFNACRIVATIACFQMFGEDVLSGSAHFALGAAAIALTMAAFAAVAALFNRLERRDRESE
ncbi:MAG: exosortase/archaeosortase family protein [Opitutales bacterium]|nr:exosortase/archaeosortase family protein [Opitutales bacterium]